MYIKYCENPLTGSDVHMRPTACDVITLIFSLMQECTGVLISLLPDATANTIGRSPFFVRRGGHCCHGNVVGRTTF